MINRNPRVLNALAVLAVFLVVVLSLGLAQFVDQLAAVDVRLAGHATVAILAAFFIAGLAIGKAVYLNRAGKPRPSGRGWIGAGRTRDLANTASCLAAAA